ncbi:hypothetical protein EJ06DRAFT_546098 [Trichodelitschia bisporula]|uniref:Uncharacterized protein n=1 Tax=Trichodelitschia bisporula TaxID=703511 RepID=A0A6G1I751_9PEZI|nr:hypothetical protein EJ06DRAFT_546098 [Trichodelitschia bisporula]
MVEVFVNPQAPIVLSRYGEAFLDQHGRLRDGFDPAAQLHPSSGEDARLSTFSSSRLPHSTISIRRSQECLTSPSRPARKFHDSIRGTGIPISSKTHVRFNIDSSPSSPGKDWSGTFPRSFLPVPTGARLKDQKSSVLTPSRGKVALLFEKGRSPTPVLKPIAGNVFAGTNLSTEPLPAPAEAPSASMTHSSLQLVTAKLTELSKGTGRGTGLVIPNSSTSTRRPAPTPVPTPAPEMISYSGALGTVAPASTPEEISVPSRTSTPKARQDSSRTPTPRPRQNSSRTPTPKPRQASNVAQGASWAKVAQENIPRDITDSARKVIFEDEKGRVGVLLPRLPNPHGRSVSAGEVRTTATRMAVCKAAPTESLSSSPTASSASAQEVPSMEDMSRVGRKNKTRASKKAAANEARVSSPLSQAVSTPSVGSAATDLPRTPTPCPGNSASGGVAPVASNPNTRGHQEPSMDTISGNSSQAPAPFTFNPAAASFEPVGRPFADRLDKELAHDISVHGGVPTPLVFKGTDRSALSKSWINPVDSDTNLLEDFRDVNLDPAYHCARTDGIPVELHPPGGYPRPIPVKDSHVGEIDTYGIGNARRWVYTSTAGQFATKKDGTIVDLPDQALKTNPYEPDRPACELPSRLSGRPSIGRVNSGLSYPPVIGFNNSLASKYGGQVWPNCNSEEWEELMVLMTQLSHQYQRHQILARGDRAEIPFGFRARSDFNQPGKHACSMRGGDGSVEPRKVYPMECNNMMLRPRVRDHRGRIEPLFPPGHTSQRINNDFGKQPVELYGGHEGIPREEDWLFKRRYICLACGSEEHGMCDCLIARDLCPTMFCLHCKQSNHWIGFCTLPPQFFPDRDQRTTMDFYIRTAHFRTLLFRANDFYGALPDIDPRKIFKVQEPASMAEPFHALSCVPCPNCTPEYHRHETEHLLDQLIKYVASDPGVDMTSDWRYNKRELWGVDRRSCPLFWKWYHLDQPTRCWLLFNPRSSIAVDALVRVYLNAQGWAVTLYGWPLNFLHKNAGVTLPYYDGHTPQGPGKMPTISLQGDPSIVQAVMDSLSHIV